MSKNGQAYIVVDDISDSGALGPFSEKVSDKIADGYIPHGDIGIVATTQGTRFIQAMVFTRRCANCRNLPRSTNMNGEVVMRVCFKHPVIKEAYPQPNGWCDNWEEEW